jgi:L-ascorbate metabolism protein UlaG (beta-lactamase superfamily)
MRFIWHGHAFYRIETAGGKTVLVDPFVENGLTRARVRDLRPDLILLTHGHADHVGSILSWPEAPVVTVPELAAWLAKGGMTRVTGMNVGGFHSPFPGLRLWMAPAVHSSGIDDATLGNGTPSYGGNPCGFVLDDGDTRAYVAGDTALFGDMRAVIGDLLRPDVAILPIGDHYTMGPEHAAVAARWLGAGVVAPYHYNTFPVITQDPQAFARGVGDAARVVVPEVDGGFEVRGGRLRAEAAPGT